MSRSVSRPPKAAQKPRRGGSPPPATRRPPPTPPEGDLHWWHGDDLVEITRVKFAKRWKWRLLVDLYRPLNGDELVHEWADALRWYAAHGYASRDWTACGAGWFDARFHDRTEAVAFAGR